MPDFMIESPHTKQECMEVMGELASEHSGLLKRFEWGCMSGHHTGWAKMKGRNESDVKRMMPSKMRDKSRVVQVTKISPKQVREYHK